MNFEPEPILIYNPIRKENTGEKKIIPVVVHIIHDFGNENVTDENCNCMALLQAQKRNNRHVKSIKERWPLDGGYFLRLYDTAGDGNCGINAFRKVQQIKGEG